VDPKCPTCNGPMCDGQKYNRSKCHGSTWGCYHTTAYCENGYYKDRCCDFCGEMIAANTTFLQCEQGYLCTAADNRPCLIDSCCKEACVEKCQKANSSCKFVERVGCHGVLQCHVAVRFGKTPAESEAVWLWGDSSEAPCAGFALYICSVREIGGRPTFSRQVYIIL